MRYFAFLLTILAFAMPASTQSVQAQTFTLHVTSYKSEYVGDKPSGHDCSQPPPCITDITTVEGFSEDRNPNPDLTNYFVIQCRAWVMTTTPIVWGKCWTLEVGHNYTVRPDGRGFLLFYDDRVDKPDPLYRILEETEKPKPGKRKPGT